MKTLTADLKKIKKRINNINNDIYDFADSVRKIIELYYFNDIFFAIEKENPYIIFNNNQILIFFVKNLSDLYQDDYIQIKNIINSFSIKQIYICVNDKKLDLDLFSEFPQQNYVGIARNNIIQIIDILIYEETLMKNKKICPYCGFSDLTYHPFIKRGFINGNLSFEPSKMLDATECLDKLICNIDKYGILLTCDNCCENFDYNFDTKIPNEFKYKTPIPKEQYFDSISLVCGDGVCKLIKVIKGNARTYYSEDLDEIINEYYDTKKDKTVEEFILNIKELIGSNES